MLAYSNIEGFETVDALFFNKVEDAAAGMSESEICMLLGVPMSRLNDIEKQTFKTAFECGRAKAKKIAIDNLFSSMRDKGGQQASLAYLTRFADGWSEEGSGIPANANFTFTVTKNP